MPRTTLLLPWLLPAALAAAAPQAPAADRDPARAFFQRGEVVRAEIALGAAERERLRTKPREYVAGELRLAGVPFAKVGIKLKGAAGSFREIDDRPGFTVHLGKFGGDARFHGLKRFHLNNGVQDESRLCEWIGHDVFAAAELPAPRVAHAHVWLDGKDLGLYVLRESFDEAFLRRVFGHADGNLYDGGFCQDVDAPLEKDAGDGGDDHADLLALCEGCRGVDPTRDAQLAKLVDVPGFVDFMALESMLNHWDGYTRNMNNYRVWLPRAGRAVFLPHGMDQLLSDAANPVLDHPPAIVASAVMQQPAFRKRYRERLKALLPLFAPARLAPRVQAIAARLHAELATTDRAAASAHTDAVRDLLARIEARHQSLERQVKAPEPKPLQLAVGKPLALKAWQPAAETEHVELARKSSNVGGTLFARCTERGAEPRHGAWRQHVLLANGRYELRGTARCEDVLPPPADEHGEHGGVRLRAGDHRSEGLRGEQPWRELVCAFEVNEFQRVVELACDLRAFTGKAWFRLDTLRLVRLPDDDAQGR
jgi:spore coat protein H